MALGIVTGGFVAMAMATALGWKWELGVLRVGVVTAVLAVLAGLLVALIDASASLGAVFAGGLTWLLSLTLAAALLSWRFYRDPDRTPPERDNVVVSPADGEVIYVKRAKAGVLPTSNKQGRGYRLHELTKTELRTGEAIVIGISLSFLDVHVNRTPVPGEVTSVDRHPGLFGSLKRPESVFQNERATLVIEREGLQVAVVLIASRLVRRIVSYVSPGDRLAAAQRIGVIRFGSQVDLVLPDVADLKVDIEPGQRLTAGETVVAVLESALPMAGPATGRGAGEP